MDNLTDFIAKFPQGISAGEIEQALKISRSTLNRRLREAVQRGDLVAIGNGPARRYQPSDSLAAIKAYLNIPYTERPVAANQERPLLPTPSLAEASITRLGQLPSHVMTKRELSKFLIRYHQYKRLFTC